MFIRQGLDAIGGLYNTLIQGSTKTKVSQGSVDLLSPIPQETLSKAVLETLPNGDLRWMVYDRCGFKEFRLFRDEKQLEIFLKERGSATIWEVEDKRETFKTFYKYDDGEEIITLKNQEELYREIASLTGYGVFCIQDVATGNKTFIQERKGWFCHGFEEITLEQATRTQSAREIAQARWRTIAVIGICYLVATPVAIGLGRAFSKNVKDLTNGSVDFLIYSTLQKTTPLLNTALFGLAVRGFDKLSPLTLPSMILGFSSVSFAKSTDICPRLLGSYTGINSAIGVDIFGNTAYVADYDYGDRIISTQIIDVSNKAKPAFTALYENISLFNIYDDISYATIGSHLQIYDVKNRAYPALLGSCNMQSGYQAWYPIVSGNYAYVNVGSDVNNPLGFQIIDVSNKVSPIVVGSYYSNSINVLAISNNYAFISIGMNFSIIDVSDKTSPNVVWNWWGVVTPESLTFSGNTAYLYGFGGLCVFDVSNKRSPKLTWEYQDLEKIYDFDLYGDTAYMTCDSGLKIFDVSNKMIPRLAGQYHDVDPTCMTVSDNFAYVGDFVYVQYGVDNVSLVILDVSNKANPQMVKQWFTGNTNAIRDVAISDYYAYLAADDGLKILSLDCAAPIGVWIGAIAASVCCCAVIAGTTIYFIKKRKHASHLENGETAASKKPLLGNQENVKKIENSIQ